MERVSEKRDFRLWVGNVIPFVYHVTTNVTAIEKKKSEASRASLAVQILRLHSSALDEEEQVITEVGQYACLLGLSERLNLLLKRPDRSA